eukprot:5782789-Alexandrium_andersonii.AAC.1
MLTLLGTARRRRLALAVPGHLVICSHYTLLAVAPDLELLREGETGALIHARPRSGTHGLAQRSLPEHR